MSVPALSPCADLVRRGDPDRFLSAMTAPPERRERLMALYAFNLEVARIPAMVSEPMLGRIRLQWWRESIDMIFEGGRARAHEVVEPLAETVRTVSLPRAPFDRLLDARERDIEGTPLRSRDDLDSYLADTGGMLLALAAHALAERAVEVAMPGFAFAAAAYLTAVPSLGPRALPGEPAETARALATDALAALDAARRTATPPDAAPALRAGWHARAVLRAATAPGYDPGRPPPPPSGLRRSAVLAWLAARGTW